MSDDAVAAVDPLAPQSLALRVTVVERDVAHINHEVTRVSLELDKIRPVVHSMSSQLSALNLLSERAESDRRMIMQGQESIIAELKPLATQLAVQSTITRDHIDECLAEKKKLQEGTVAQRAESAVQHAQNQRRLSRLELIYSAGIALGCIFAFFSTPIGARLLHLLVEAGQ